MSGQNLDKLLRSRDVLAIGEPTTALERGLLQRLAASAASLEQVVSKPALHAQLKRASLQRLAVVFDARLIGPRAIAALAESGCRGVIWPSADPIPDAVLQAARPHRLRFLGPRSAGFFHGSGLSAGEFPPDMAAGSLALITQSGSIAAAAIDWASGRGIGFSWAVTTGAEQDADVADFLDVAALDPNTRAVILQVGAVRGGRKFMSAARACARLKPVVVLQSRVGGRAALSGADPVRSAAFARAGLVECLTLDGLFDALTALARIPARDRVRVMTVGNGAGLCALGVDAVLRQQLALGACSDETFDAIHQLAPRARRLEGAIDAGPTEPEALAGLCGALLADPQCDYLLLVHSPQLDSAHRLYVDALLSAQLGPRLVTVWLGLKTALDARRRSTEAGLATFVTAGQAARALRYRWLHGRTRELLMQTPPPSERAVVDCETARGLLDAALSRACLTLDAAAANDLLDRYRLPSSSADTGAQQFELAIERHREFGTHLTITAVSGLLRSTTARAFPPLDGLLAQRMIEAMELALPAAMQAPLMRALSGVSQMALDLAPIAALRLTLAVDAAGELHRSGDAQLQLDAQPAPERQRLVLAPYPETLGKIIVSRRGRRYRVRPIRPEDEPALITLLERLRPEDIRMRFFAAIRYFSHEMAARMTQIDYDRELVLTAEAEDEPSLICAVAHLVTDPYGESGEFALLVHHDHAGSGLGRQLMGELLAHGRRQGLQRIHGDVLRQNMPMLALARSLGFVSRDHDDEPDSRHIEIDLQPSPAPVDQR
ncbi:MAG: Protein acetyltransferase [Hydrocarboniphaga sp.]|uniref:bifunctional acetate--CoA ligase family protein/GNAT family N-acetyltransferase n=1 Tax=Hydrocarboniphaga sp. TaxID=2033016 RepID=UPI0026151BC3|nr:GNAT family N-acetyltransferase [Hydrocarboniphaga sp.]MDB5970852.1 Protein acetyltransferase [Hydrocarboniphaga sp.]